MKLAELKASLKKDEDGSNMTKAKKIRGRARLSAKENNPEQTDEPIGWNADPHAGGHGSSFLGRAVS